jgi:hypothetical protein
VKPTRLSLPSALTNQRTAVICSQLPTLEMSAPDQLPSGGRLHLSAARIKTAARWGWKR